VLGFVGAEERHLAGGALMAAHEPAADHDPGAHPLAGEDADDVVHAGGDAAPALADHGEVAVVLHDDRRPSERASTGPSFVPGGSALL
jgi:hypothetical protein